VRPTRHYLSPNDTKLLAVTLEAIVVERALPTEEKPQHLRLDKGDDHPTRHKPMPTYQYTPHFRRIGAEKLDLNGQKSYPAHRWVAERIMACSPSANAFSSVISRRPPISLACCNSPVS
jgi:hypothetical protein